MNKISIEEWDNYKINTKVKIKQISFNIILKGEAGHPSKADHELKKKMKNFIKQLQQIYKNM